MSIKPILFNTEMVRAILDGQKTQTRRIMKPQAYCTVPKDCAVCNAWRFDGKTTSECPPSCVTTPDQPYNVGDILWVRETYCEPYAPGMYAYRADYDEHDIIPNSVGHVSLSANMFRWKPSIHMPKQAARIFLRVTDVRVERLQDIDDDGVVAEGLEIGAQIDELWNRTLSKSDRAKFGWDANPWTWVIEFERCEKPVGWWEVL